MLQDGAGTGANGDGGRAEQAMAAHRRELIADGPLMGGPADREAVAAFLDEGEPDFGAIPGL